MRLELEGPGELSLTLHQILGDAPRKKSTAYVGVDLTHVRSVTLGTRPGGGHLVGVPSSSLSAGREHTATLPAGKHSVDITAPDTPIGVAVRIHFFPEGSSTFAPVTVEPEHAAKLSTSGTRALANLIAAPGESSEERLTRLFRAGKARHGLLGTYPTRRLIHLGNDTERAFHHVEELESYAMLLEGPGVLTVRVHRLINSRQEPTTEVPYSVVIIENDIVLQTLNDEVAPSRVWALSAGDNPHGLLVSTGKEYRLKLGPKRARVVLQTPKSPEGMLIDHDFAPAERPLAALALTLDEVASHDGETSPPVPSSQAATVVLARDVPEQVPTPDRDYVSLGARVGIRAPQLGRTPGVAALGEVTFLWPLFDGKLHTGVEAGYLRESLDARAMRSTIEVHAGATIQAVPIFFRIAWHQALTEHTGAYGGMGGGPVFLQAERHSVGATTAVSDWTFGVRPAAGAELQLGPGWIGAEAAYLFVPRRNYGDILREYTPGAFELSLQYRLSI